MEVMGQLGQVGSLQWVSGTDFNARLDSKGIYSLGHSAAVVRYSVPSSPVYSSKQYIKKVDRIECGLRSHCPGEGVLGVAGSSIQDSDLWGPEVVSTPSPDMLLLVCLTPQLSL